MLDIMMYGRGPLEPVRDHPQLELVEGDFRHVDNVVQAMQDVESVVHLGAIVGDPACKLDESLTIDINLSSTRMIAQLAKSHQVQRFIFASTCSVYGARPGPAGRTVRGPTSGNLWEHQIRLREGVTGPGGCQFRAHDPAVRHDLRIVRSHPLRSGG